MYIKTSDESTVEAILKVARSEYTATNPNSFKQYLEACAVLPGGNTRTALFHLPFPLNLVRGEGANLWDADGHRYTDFLGDHTAALFGHSDTKIRDAIDNALDNGIDLGGRTEAEAKLASLLCARFPSIQMVRFTNSGTEANLMAISATCAITRRQKILVFDGAYHGTVFNFTGEVDSLNAPFEFVVGRYNDIEYTLSVLDQNSNSLAAVIVEPMMGPAGCIPAEVGFLQMLRDWTNMHGTFLIFDEVMTSRLAPGGLQEVYAITPDITTLGKYIGGGMTFGAFGGRADIMERFDARQQNSFSHSGTFNNNVLTMSAGVTAMSLYTPDIAKQHNARGDQLRHRLNDLIQNEGANMQFTGFGSMLCLHLVNAAIKSPTDVSKAEIKLRELFFLDTVARGFWIGPQGLIALSLPVTDSDCNRYVAVVAEIISLRRQLLKT